MLQCVSGSSLEDRKLIDSFQQTIELRPFRAIESMLSILGQELVQACLSGRREETFRQRFQLAGAQANQYFGVILHREISRNHN